MFKENGKLYEVKTGDLELLRQKPEEFWEGVTEIGFQAFYGLDIDEIKIPSTVEKIGSEAFVDCKNLKEIVIPDSVVKMGINTFDGCENLEKAYVSSSVERVPSFAFRDCSKLKEVSIAKYTVCAETAFQNCPDNLEVERREKIKGNEGKNGKE